MPLSQELRKRFAAHVGADESATEDAILAAVATELDARKADIQSFNAAKLSLTRERDEFKMKAETATLALSSKSGEPTPPDPFTVGIINRLIRTEREAAIAKGVSRACVDALDKLFMSDGKPTTLALSRSAGDTDPIYCRVLEVLKLHGGEGVKYANGVDRTTIAAGRAAGADDPAIALGDAKEEDTTAAAEWAKKWKEERLAERQTA